MNTISFMSANFVARQVGYHMTEGWGQGERATNACFRPLETFGQRFEELLTAVRAMGFDTIDIWTAHLNWAWATDRHIAIARELLDRHGLAVASLAGGFGASAEEFDAACRLAVALHTKVLGGGAPFYDTQRDSAIATLDRHDLKLGIENHPGVETPEQMLAKIGDGGHGRIGTAVDTGWYGTVGLDAAQAIEQLGKYVFHVHLKDVRAPGSHETCRYGQGIVPIQACVEALQQLGSQGAISVEHEPEDFDPTEDCKANLALLRQWLRQ
jgi:L-ribulose-5-phosphate 3-epimerase